MSDKVTYHFKMLQFQLDLINEIPMEHNRPLKGTNGAIFSTCTRPSHHLNLLHKKNNFMHRSLPPGNDAADSHGNPCFLNIIMKLIHLSLFRYNLKEFAKKRKKKKKRNGIVVQWKGHVGNIFF